MRHHIFLTSTAALLNKTFFWLIAEDKMVITAGFTARIESLAPFKCVKTSNAWSVTSLQPISALGSEIAYERNRPETISRTNPSTAVGAVQSNFSKADIVSVLALAVSAGKLVAIREEYSKRSVENPFTNKVARE
mmetsp:Transcript_11508/g.24393  ORF Transcript_11508/g.24393 Transcript_11508/m.24393 type:complete len:135 (+) Transcript_11508:871-1275(+)